MEIPENVQIILDNLPQKPGCYIMKNATGTIIYVGKAINLRSRVRSYFHKSSQHDQKTIQMVKNINDIETIVVGSELEALILEMNLIKKHKPRFNVRLKDDKRYPYIKVHNYDPFPKVTITRNMVKDGSKYFGPYTSVWAVHKTLDLLRKIFPYRTCDRIITGNDERACLYFDIKLCTAPCIGKASQQDYNQMIQDLSNFLNGRTEDIVSRLKKNMEAASNEMKYEHAAQIRDQIKAIENVVEKQKVVSSTYLDSDVIAMARSDREACIQIFFIRGGKLIGSDYFLMEGTEESPDESVLEEFIKQFYEQAATVPQQLLLPTEVEEANIIRQWLSTRSEGQKVEIAIPKRGPKKDLVKMAAENAASTLNTLQAQWDADKHRQTQALTELQKALHLENPPNRIECYDISTTQGTAIVGSMVVFERGVPNKAHYRRFNIRNVVGHSDDYASMEETLNRRFRRWQSAMEKSEMPGKKPDPSFAMLPDLLIVDGGKGQLGKALEVLQEYDLTGKVPVVGIAKQNEEIFMPGEKTGLLLPRRSEGFYLVQRIRDEAHRFAITAHRNRRSKQGIASQLDIIPGIGPTKRKALLKEFGSIDAIRNAEPEDLAKVPGINLNLANQIKGYME
ncbi:MAG: excinuclease ABC subunit UvrC [Anaerolineales bacterium]|nr:excinuclease ABC subunit UvrC [Anaerolineales bacterium]